MALGSMLEAQETAKCRAKLEAIKLLNGVIIRKLRLLPLSLGKVRLRS